MPSNFEYGKIFCTFILKFKEYEFNIEDLPEFKYYRFKFILTSTNQTYVPKVSNLRVITLA